MTRHPGRMALLSLLMALGVGVVVAGLSQMGAVSVDDPRPSVPPAVTLTPLPTASSTATPTIAATPTPTPEPEVWLYTLVAGDSLSGVAVRWGTTTEDLLDLNPEYENNENLIRTGAQLVMPCTPIAQAEDRC